MSYNNAIEAAAIFLTRPLNTLCTHSPATLIAIQFLLQSTLPNNTNTILSFSPTSLPPLPIQLACIAYSVNWADWIRVLGGSAFDLVIEQTRVYVIKKLTGQIGVIWTFVPPSPQLDSDEDQSPADISRPSSRSSVSSSFSVFSSRSSTSSKTSFSSLCSHESKIDSLSPSPAHGQTRTSKPTAPTKYLYQGGVSTVLTGGVMLGSATTARSPSSSSASSLSSTSTSTSTSTSVNKKHITIPTTTVGANVSVYTPPHHRATYNNRPLRKRAAGNANDAIPSWRLRSRPVDRY